MVILQHPFVFCSGQIGELKEDVVGITTLEAFKSLVVASISVNPAGKQHHLFLFLSFCSITVVLIIPPLLSSTLPTPTSYIQSTPHLSLSLGPLYMFFDDPSPFFPPLSPSLLSSGHCQFLLNFSVSGSILLACLFC